ncbi:conserved hypothetical protein [Hyella patelloides LEGE 07179]|uniref:Uncharacterized protein n=1 Tax=Hyella patelloides LEGE 07179 TaxID=945734 RepID=A0A563VNY5_9CYAN|nr:conserved hypothetical protein [Hyella patelloides LEGE 07179]
MTPEEEKELTEHINAIAQILYRQAKPEQIETLAKIEETVREQILEHISPKIGIFLAKKEQEQM